MNYSKMDGLLLSRPHYSDQVWIMSCIYSRIESNQRRVVKLLSTYQLGRSPSTKDVFIPILHSAISYGVMIIPCDVFLWFIYHLVVWNVYYVPSFWVCQHIMEIIFFVCIEPHDQPVVHWWLWIPQAPQSLTLHDDPLVKSLDFVVSRARGLQLPATVPIWIYLEYYNGVRPTSPCSTLPLRRPASALDHLKAQKGWSSLHCLGNSQWDPVLISMQCCSGEYQEIAA